MDTCAVGRLDQLDAVALADMAGTHDRSVQREPAVKPTDDALKHAVVLRERVRIERRHHASSSQIRQRDQHIADAKALALPRPLGQALHSSDHEIWAEPAAVVAECRDGAVGRDEERQDVEPRGAIVQDQPCPATDDVLDVGGDTRIRPGAAVHERLALSVQHGAVTEQLRMGSRGDHASTRVLDMDDSVAIETERRKAHLTQPLAGHRLYWVSPELRHVHGRLLSRCDRDPPGGCRFERHPPQLRGREHRFYAVRRAATRAATWSS